MSSHDKRNWKHKNGVIDEIWWAAANNMLYVIGRSKLKPEVKFQYGVNFVPLSQKLHLFYKLGCFCTCHRLLGTCALKMPKASPKHAPKTANVHEKLNSLQHLVTKDDGSKVAELTQQISQKMILPRSTLTI